VENETAEDAEDAEVNRKEQFTTEDTENTEEQHTKKAPTQFYVVVFSFIVVVVLCRE
jgi:hypothetical protein